MMKKLVLLPVCIFILLIIFGCSSSNTNDSNIGSDTNLTGRVITIDYNNVSVQAVVDVPESKEVDVILAYHGTAMYDLKIVEAAQTMLTNTKNIIQNNDVLYISVAYPEEGLLIGDNIKQAEAALLWTKNNAEEEFGVKIKKIYLIGHSQGGYLVTRLNTMYQTDGVIANGPGPIDLVIRCGVEENNNTSDYLGVACGSLYSAYGGVSTNPDQYIQRSLINFTSNYKSKILFVQGMNDTKFQLQMWPKFKNEVSKCTNCAEYTFLEIPNGAHGAAFNDPTAKDAINTFISN